MGTESFNWKQSPDGYIEEHRGRGVRPKAILAVSSFTHKMDLLILNHDVGKLPDAFAFERAIAERILPELSPDDIEDYAQRNATTDSSIRKFEFMGRNITVQGTLDLLEDHQKSILARLQGK